MEVTNSVEMTIVGLVWAEDVMHDTAVCLRHCKLVISL
jgi:hypothetical protein